MKINQIHNIRQALLQWFYTNKRDLPWRDTRDPYLIWVSEIMLQQTKVDTVIPYYNAFVKQYPTIDHLAIAEEERVLKLWEGLGYYSRAKNLHRGVKEVKEVYRGEVPNDKDTLLKIPGIGDYTAGAILSIAFQQGEPAIDGNVLRVITRIFRIFEDISKVSTKRKVTDIVKELIPDNDPSAFNQGLMELGALICTPKSPKCESCPILSSCESKKNEEQLYLPIKKKKKSIPNVYRISLIMADHQHILLKKRPKEGLLADLWELPSIELEQKLSSPLTKEEWQWRVHDQIGKELRLGEKWGSLEHTFSHKKWLIEVYYATFLTADFPNENCNDDRWTVVKYDKLKELTFPRVYQEIIKEFKK